MHESHSSSYFGENLRMFSYCPLCETKHGATEAKILDDNEGAKLVYITCKKCATSVVAVVVQNPLGMTSMGVITDLTSADVMKFREGDEVSSDDALFLHEFLTKHPRAVEQELSAA